MPVQVVVGLSLTLGGLAGLIVSLIFKLDAGVIAASTVMSTGTGLLGKEMFAQSDHAQQTFSKRPPPIDKVGVLWLALLVAPAALYFGGCAGMQLPQSQEALDAKTELDNVADRLDARLTVARGLYDIASYGLDGVCSPTPSKACSEARVVLNVVGGHLKNADDAIDYYRETGTRFDAAHNALKEAERRVGELRSLVAKLREAFT